MQNAENKSSGQSDLDPSFGIHFLSARFGLKVGSVATEEVAIG